MTLTLSKVNASAATLKIPEVSDSDSGEVSDTIPVDFRTLVLGS